MTDVPLYPKVAEKWGFGMAPPKRSTAWERERACDAFLGAIASLEIPDSTQEVLDAASVVKGLFNRVVREDQWDWFTVCRQLGYPSRRISDAIAKEIASFRSAIRDADREGWLTARTNLHRLPLRRCLAVFRGRARLSEEPGAGWVYILSTREHPDLLKIGMTTRTVEQRAGEINGATGVAIPFGVRRCWRVSEPQKAERLVHTTLAEHRLRNDREFFRVSFLQAAKLLDGAIRASGLEIRTLNALAALDSSRAFSSHSGFKQRDEDRERPQEYV
jgi:hypothetical protein